MGFFLGLVLYDLEPTNLLSTTKVVEFGAVNEVYNVFTYLHK